MEVERLAEGLWRWTGEAGDGVVAESLYLESGPDVVLIDPIVPPEDRERFLRALDKDVARLGGSVQVALSSPGLRARADELVRRYDAAVWTAGDPGDPPPGVAAVHDGGTVRFRIVEHQTTFPAE